MAVLALVVTEPANSSPSLLTLKESVVRVEPFINSEKVADTDALIATFAAASVGLVDSMVSFP